MVTEARAQLAKALKSYQGGTPQSKFERDATVNGILTTIKRLDTDNDPLIFGRIDLDRQDGKREAFHIGRMGVLDDNLDPLVIDWRAPMAEPFYRATGRDTMGLVLRRHIEVRNRKVLSLEDEWFVAQDDKSTYPHELSDGSSGDSETNNSRDTSNVGAPGALLTALERPRSAHMRDMIATIQKEQDEIIRSSLRGTLAVQGGPGTGKTAVALHRAAYLLYTHRFPLETQGILVIGPNPVFLKYIEHVLPSLGESGVHLASLQGLVRGISPSFNDAYQIARLKGDIRMAKLLRRAIRTRERPLRDDQSIPYGSATLVLRANDTNRMIAEVRRLRGTHNAKRAILEQMISNYLLEQYRARTHIAAAGDREREKITQWLHEMSDELANIPTELPTENALPKDGELAELNAVTEVDNTIRNITDAKATEGILKVPELRTALWRMWPRLTPEMLLNDLFGSKALLQAAGKGLFTSEELSLLYRESSVDPSDIKWSYEDLALIDEARVLLGTYDSGVSKNPKQDNRHGANKRRTHFSHSHSAHTGRAVADPDEESTKTYGYIVVDEIQRLSPMELRMIARRSTSANMTLVGDLAQATGANPVSSWDDIYTYMNLDTENTRKVELTVSYRTPEEILKAARPVVDSYMQDIPPVSAIRSTGIRPKAHRLEGDLSRTAASLAVSIVTKLLSTDGRSDSDEFGGEPGDICAIIAPSALCNTLADLFTDLLERHELPWNQEIQLVSGDSAVRSSALNIVPASLSSGLEFDHVILVDPKGIIDESPMGIKSLYVAMTRPTKTLHLLYSGELPQMLNDGIMLN